MAATEDSGVFDIGTFDNAQFDTIEQPSSLNIFSTENSTFNLGVSSFVFAFSDLGREIQRDLSSFVGLIDSTVDARLQKFKGVSSFAQVFSNSDFTLGKKVISTISVFSQADSTIDVIRETASNIFVNSRNNVIFTLRTASNILVNSVNEYERIFNRAVDSSLTVFSNAVRVIPGFQWFIDGTADVLKKIEGEAKTRFNIEGEAN